MADKHDDQHKHEDKKDKSKKREKRDSAIRGAISALKYMPAMNPDNLAPIPDEVKGTTDEPKDSDED